jgi:hypothetical protein
MRKADPKVSPEGMSAHARTWSSPAKRKRGDAQLHFRSHFLHL